MLVICEDCAKKYNIDESKIKGNRARFTCNECGHIIIVNKSDLARPLVHAPEQDSSPSSPTIDLLKEMETPLEFESDSPAGNSPIQSDEQISSETEKTKSRKFSLPIPGFFLVGGLISFIITNAGVAYILSQYSTVISSQQKEFQFDMLITAVLVMVVTWAISFVALFVLGSYLSKAVNNLVSVLHRVNMGERNVDVVVANGPRELMTLGQILSELTKKVH